MLHCANGPPSVGPAQQRSPRGKRAWRPDIQPELVAATRIVAVVRAARHATAAGHSHGVAARGEAANGGLLPSKALQSDVTQRVRIEVS